MATLSKQITVDVEYDIQYNDVVNALKSFDTEQKLQLLDIILSNYASPKLHIELRDRLVDKLETHLSKIRRYED